MARKIKDVALQNRLWLRAPKSEQERLADVWIAGDDAAYRKMVLELGRVYG